MDKLQKIKSSSDRWDNSITNILDPKSQRLGDIPLMIEILKIHPIYYVNKKGT